MADQKSPSPTPSGKSPTPEQQPQAGGWGWVGRWASAAASGVSNSATWCKDAVKSAFGWENFEVVKTSEQEQKQSWDDGQRQSLWKRLSSLVGQDVVSMITLPVWVFEPMSFLEILAEPIAYADLLHQCAASQDPYERLALLAAFNCSIYSIVVRAKKMFNPLLGETFELAPKEGNVRLFAEQVSHHPPISVARAEAVTGEWNLLLDAHVKSKYYGNSADVLIDGTNHFHLATTGDHYTWGHITSRANNVIIGSIWIDHFGDVKIKNEKGGEWCDLHFHKCGLFSYGRYEVTGEIYSAEGKLKALICGKWNDRIAMVPVEVEDGASAPNVTVNSPGAKVLWRPTLDAGKDEVWGHNAYTWREFHNLSDEQLAQLPKTDSRLRGDRRNLLLGNLELAASEKQRLEEKQRAEAHERKAAGEEYSPRFFKDVKNEKGEHVTWELTNNYWEERERRLAAAAAADAAAASSSSAAAEAPQQ